MLLKDTIVNTYPSGRDWSRETLCSEEPPDATEDPFSSSCFGVVARLDEECLETVEGAEYGWKFNPEKSWGFTSVEQKMMRRMKAIDTSSCTFHNFHGHKNQGYSVHSTIESEIPNTAITIK